MKYLLFNILADGTPTTRFARELALAIEEAKEPLRILQLGQATVGGEIFTISRHLLETRYQRLIKLMWGPIIPGREMYVFGDIREVVERILQRGECAPINYAFVTLASWDDSPQHAALAKGLQNYDRVFVFSQSDFEQLEKLGVDSEVVNDVKDYIHIPQPTDDGEEVLGRTLIVVPSDDNVSDEERNAVLSHLELDREIGDAVFNIHLPEGEWNMSYARNLGIKYAQENGYDYVAFNDVDVFPPNGYWHEVKKELSKSEDNVVVPKFVGQPSGIAGTASGNVALHVKKALEIGGYDETYKGGGSEDIDFLFRLKRDTVCFEITPSYPPLLHMDHEPRSDRVNSDKVNEQRVRRIMDYEDLPIQSCLLDQS